MEPTARINFRMLLPTPSHGILACFSCVERWLSCVTELRLREGGKTSMLSQASPFSRLYHLGAEGDCLLFLLNQLKFVWASFYCWFHSPTDWDSCGWVGWSDGPATSSSGKVMMTLDKMEARLLHLLVGSPFLNIDQDGRKKWVNNRDKNFELQLICFSPTTMFSMVSPLSSSFLQKAGSTKRNCLRETALMAVAGGDGVTFLKKSATPANCNGLIICLMFLICN